MEQCDMYKLVYQGAMGSGHFFLSEETAEKRLTGEFSLLKPHREEYLIEKIPTTADMVRINLRPWLAEGLNKSVLLRAFSRTCREFTGNTEDIEHLWKASGGGDFIRKMSQKGYPAVHHSETYRKLYHPAYRVVQASILKEEGFQF
ncbi:hypothetical protein CSA37_03990 [Candidatus Fermentibacteria bacterium]|nr:MAG: hypothetical protein CSA37_10725 [Candidatus Fermentibacteria bacterium]PIE52813.1 MAG: hypothetical protein CSA37_03990 [Candidatus Fermentibacteria bacterium]